MPDREPVRARARRAPTGWPGSCARSGLEVDEDDSGPAVSSDAGNLLARIPGRGSRASCCARTWTPSRWPRRSSRCSSTAAGRTPTTGSSAPTTSRRSPSSSSWPGASRAAAEPPADRHRAPVHRLRGECRCSGSEEFDVVTAAERVRLRVRPRHADRRDRRRLAHPLPDRRRAPRAAPPTPGSARRSGAARSSPPPTAIAAMRLGRLDAETTANVGTIDGRHARSTSSPSAAAIEAEVRSLDDDRPPTVATEIVDHLQDAANAGECDLDVNVERMFAGYRTKAGRLSWRSPSAPCARAATSRATSQSGGASDANSFEAAGFSCTTWPTGPSATTSRASGSASRPWRACSTSRSH